MTFDEDRIALALKQHANTRNTLLIVELSQTVYYAHVRFGYVCWFRETLDKSEVWIFATMETAHRHVETCTPLQSP